MKKTPYLLILTLIFSTYAFGQNKSLNDMYISSIDSLINKQLTFQKENRNSEVFVFLKDSVFSYYFDDVFEECENQPIKSYYSYDEYGFMTTLIVKNTPGEGCEASKSKALFTYLDFNLTDRISQLYDFTLDEWFNSSKREYQYNTEDNVVDETRYQWNSETSTWDKYLKFSYIYDGNLEIDQKRFHWDSGINDWFWDLNFTNSYDSNNNLLEYIYRSWDYGLNDWETLRKIKNTYDTNSNLTEFIDYRKYASEDIYEWNRIYKNVYYYDDDNLLIEKLYFTLWNNEVEDWDKEYKLNYTNNAFGDPILIQTYLWKDNSETWENFSNELYTYNSDLRLIEKFKEVWEVADNSWENQSLQTNTYNEFNNVVERLYQYWSGNNWYTEGELTYEYDEFQNLVHFQDQYVFSSLNVYYYYSEYDIELNTIDNVLVNQYAIIPNPSNDYIMIAGIEQNATILFYNVSGKKVLETNFDNRIDISNFRNGLYFVKIITNDSTKVIKLLKN